MRFAGANNANGSFAPEAAIRDRMEAMSAIVRIVLQKSKVAPVRIFGETSIRDAIDDSNNFSRVTEVAHEFCVRR
jgi:hypothetical protein